MTDPKSISRNREVYTDQYGNARPPTREQSVNASYEASVDVSDEFGSDIATNPNVPSEYQEFFADQPPGQGAPNDGQLMDGVHEQVEGSLPPGAQPIQWESSHILDEVKDLLKDNKDLLQNAEAYDQFNDQYKELVRKSRNSGTNPEELMEKVEELKDNLSGAIEDIRSNNGDKFEAAIHNLESLVSRVEHSRLPSSQKSDLKERLEAKIDDLKQGKRENQVFDEAAEDSIEDLQKEVNRAIGEHDLKNGFENAVNHIPAKGWNWEKAVELGRRVRDAVNNGDWDSVSAYLSGLPSNEANNVVQQFLGSLYYGPAGKDEEKLSQLLALIPENVRESMATATLSNEGERLSGENVDTDAHKEEFSYYGNPTVTADRLRRDDIADALDSLGETSSDED